MKKRILAIVMAFGLSCTPLGAYAQETELPAETEVSSESEMTLEEIARLQKDFAETVDSVSMNMDINLDVSVDSSSENTPNSTAQVSFRGSYDSRTILDPMQMQTNGDIQISLSGFSMNISTESYIVVSEEKNLVDLYTRANDGASATEWVHTQADFSRYLDAMNISDPEELKDLSAEELLSDAASLDWELEDKGDVCSLSTVIHCADLLPLIERFLDAQPQSGDVPMDLLPSLLESLTASLSMTVDKETGATLSMHMDMNESDIDALNRLLADIAAQYAGGTDGFSMPQLKLDLGDFSVDCDYAYNNVDEIIIPADALTAPVYTPDSGYPVYGDDTDEADTEAQTPGLSVLYSPEHHAGHATHEYVHHGYHG